MNFGEKVVKSWTGRMTITLDKEINSTQSIEYVEQHILNELKKSDNDIESVELYSFSLIEKVYDQID